MKQDLSLQQKVQQKVSLYAKWFQWIVSEFIGHSEHDLMGK
jgi:hypothetical protein